MYSFEKIHLVAEKNTNFRVYSIYAKISFLFPWEFYLLLSELSFQLRKQHKLIQMLGFKFCLNFILFGEKQVLLVFKIGQK